MIRKTNLNFLVNLRKNCQHPAHAINGLVGNVCDRLAIELRPVSEQPVVAGSIESLLPGEKELLRQIGADDAQLLSAFQDVHHVGPDLPGKGGKRLALESCHSPGNELPLSGSNFAVKFEMPPLGTLYAPNLTPSGDIRDWSDGEVIRAIRDGVHKDGRSLLIMPSNNFRNMSDEDVQALVAYLRTQPATGGPTPHNQFSVLGAIFMNLSDFRTAQQPAGRVTAPQAGTPEYGKYLVDVIGCRDCHGAQLQGKVDNGMPGPPVGPNLTKMIPHWTEEQFMAFFNTGIMPGGGKVPVIILASGFSEPRMPWSMVRAAATDDDLKAMYNYLHNLPAVDSPTR